MDTYDAALLALFRNFLLQALGLARGALEVIDCRLYAHPRLKGAAIARFELKGQGTFQTLGFLPSPLNRDPKAKALFDDLMDAPDALKPIHALIDVRCALQLLLSAIECRVEGGTLKYTRTLSEAQALAALETAQEAQEYCGGFTGERVKFRTLAREILSGAPYLHFDHTDGAEGFEVYGFSDDPFGTIIVRTFDHGATLLVATASSHEGAENPKFHAACEQLLKARLSCAEKDSGSPKFKRLELVEAFERLGRLLGQELSYGLTLGEPQVFGTPSPEAANRLAQLANEEALDEPSLTEPTTTLFDVALRTLEELEGEPLWSEEAEANGEPRIEMLTHIEHPHSTILINYLPCHPKVHGAWTIFIPDTDPQVLETVQRDLDHMLKDRRAFSAMPVPMGTEYPFRRVPQPIVKRLLEDVQAACARNEGTLCEQIILRGGDNPPPAIPTFCMPTPERSILH